MSELVYSQEKLRAILSRVRTIALVGASSSWKSAQLLRDEVLQSKGYRVIPVNPGTAASNSWARPSMPRSDIPSLSTW